MGFSCPRGWATEWRGKVSALRGGLPTGARAGLAARRRSRSQPMRLWCSSAERLTCVGKARLSYPKFPGGKWGISLESETYPPFLLLGHAQKTAKCRIDAGVAASKRHVEICKTFFCDALQMALRAGTPKPAAAKDRLRRCSSRPCRRSGEQVPRPPATPRRGASHLSPGRTLKPHEKARK